MSRTVAAKVPELDDYLELVRAFPLRPLRNKSEHAAALKTLDGLIASAALTPGQTDYAHALAVFVERYERERHAAGLPKVSPPDLLRFLMGQHNMNTTDLGYVLGSRGLASEVLNGKRGLSKTLIFKLARKFQVDPAVFLRNEE